MDIQVVLEASAVAIVIGAGISYLTFRNSSKLTYITQERKEWRAEIRKIAEKLEECPYENRKQVLVKLKTRINAYGKTDSRKTWNICEDSHIWEKIEQIERCTTEKKYNIYREQLICFLSLMLKTDWERAKKEVTGEPWKITQILSAVFFVVYMFLGFFEDAWGKVDDLKSIMDCIIGNMGFVFIAIMFFIASKGLLVMGKLKKNIVEFLVSSLLWVFVIVAGAELLILKENIYVGVAGGALTLIGICQIIIELREYSVTEIYISRVKKIDPSFGKCSGKNKKQKDDKEADKKRLRRQRTHD